MSAKGSVRLQRGTWYLRTWQDGVEQKPIRLGSKKEIKNQAQAELARDAYWLRLNPTAISKSKLLTVEELGALYLSNRVALMKRSSAYSAASIINRHIVPTLGKLGLSQLQPLVLQKTVNALHANQLSRKTISNVLACLSCMLDFAREYGYSSMRLDRKLVRLPPQEVAKERRYFTPDEAARIIDAAEYPWKACWAILAVLGLRTGEVLGLCWTHIDFGQRVIHVRQSAVNGSIQTVKSKNSQADLPMPDELCEILRAYDGWLDDSTSVRSSIGLLFPNEYSQPYTGNQVRQQFFYPLLKQLGIKHGGLHAFRHGVATNLFRSGASAATVKAGLRHGRIETTLGYTHTVTDDGRKAFGDNAKLFNRNKPEQDTTKTTGNS